MVKGGDIGVKQMTGRRCFALKARRNVQNSESHDRIGKTSGRMSSFDKRSSHRWYISSENG